MTALVSIAAVLVIIHFGWPLAVAAWVLVAVAADRVWSRLRGPVATHMGAGLLLVGAVVAAVAAFAVLAGTVIGVSAGVLEAGRMYIQTERIEATLVDDH